MKALLLNSGVGSRMGARTADRPKTMCPILGEQTILSNQIALLWDAGVREAVVTTGPFAELLQSYLRSLPQPMRYTFVPNPRYRETNYIYSMYLARKALAGEDVLSLHGDLVLEPAVMQELSRRTDNAMVIDTTLPLPEKDFKARLREGRIVEVGVRTFGADCAACQAAYHWTSEGMEAWMDEIARFCERGEIGVYAENAFNALNGALALHPLDARGRLCSEIDNEEDLQVVSAAFAALRG